MTRLYRRLRCLLFGHTDYLVCLIDGAYAEHARLDWRCQRCGKLVGQPYNGEFK